MILLRRGASLSTSIYLEGIIHKTIPANTEALAAQTQAAHVNAHVQVDVVKVCRGDVHRVSMSSIVAAVTTVPMQKPCMTSSIHLS